MSEERFVVGSNEIGEIIVTDVETGNVYRYDDISKFFGLIRLLNEQQATIDKLRVDIRATRTTIRRLQDICGKSDGENAKLRIENKRLYNYFRDYLEDEMSAENFGEMWDNVKEDERWNDE